MAWDTEQASTKLLSPGPVRGLARGRAWTTLITRADFVRATAGKRRATPAFVVQYTPRTAEAPSLRIGFTASRKVGNAVARNRSKRRLRALADKVMPEVGDLAFDYVLVARPEAIVRDFAIMESELRQALQKIAQGERGAKP